MASEIARERVYGAFRDPSQRYPTKAQKDAKKALRAGMSAGHLFLIRQLWCCVGHKRPVDAHHLQGGPCRKDRGLGLKSADKWALPLDHDLHMLLHSRGSRNEYDFFWEHRIDPYALAAALWAATGDIGRMSRVLTAHQLHASRELLKVRR